MECPSPRFEIKEPTSPFWIATKPSQHSREVKVLNCSCNRPAALCSCSLKVYSVKYTCTQEVLWSSSQYLNDPTPFACNTTDAIRKDIAGVTACGKRKVVERGLPPNLFELQVKLPKHIIECDSSANKHLKSYKTKLCENTFNQFKVPVSQQETGRKVCIPPRPRARQTLHPIRKPTFSDSHPCLNIPKPVKKAATRVPPKHIELIELDPPQQKSVREVIEIDCEPDLYCELEINSLYASDNVKEDPEKPLLFLPPHLTGQYTLDLEDVKIQLATSQV